MSKTAPASHNPTLSLDESAAAPLYRQLYERLRAQILAGQLETGARLPSSRALATELGVSRNTIALAYELLLLEGYTESRVGDGTRVARIQSAQPLRQQPADQPAPLSRRGHLLIDTARSDEIYTRPTASPSGLFRIGQPDTTHFPYETWARIVSRLARHALPDFALYQNAQGHLPLREAIAAHIGISRGVHCSPDRIILTAGSQGALDLVARVLLDPGDVAWVEDPGYLGAKGALLASGVKLAPVPVDEAGIMVDIGQARYAQARLAVVTPSHQFPTAVTMSLARRLALLEWSRANSAWIVEDDYDSEYRYSGRPLEALQGLDNAGRVIYVGTFSKVLFPSLRLGYLVVPPALRDGFLAARRFVDVHMPLLEQMALAEFIAAGHFARHLRKMRGIYLERRNALVAALKRELGDTLSVAAPEAGLHLVAWLPPGIDGAAIAARAAADSLHITTISHIASQPLERDGLLLGFAGATPAELSAGVQTLARHIKPNG